MVASCFGCGELFMQATSQADDFERFCSRICERAVMTEMSEKE